MRHRKSLVVCAAAGIIAAIVPAPWRISALGANQPSQGNAPVRTAPAGQRFGANPGQKGATYYALEGQAIRMTARFADAVAVTERGFDGDLQTTLSDAGGTELARLKVDRVDGVNDVVQYVPRSGKSVQAYGESAVRPTLDWSSHQAYSLWKDRVDGDSQQLEWRGNVMRRRGGAARDVEKAVVELQTEWANGLTAKTVRRSVSRHAVLPGRALNGEVLVTRLTRDGAEVGVVNWFPESRILMWNLPGLTKGYIAPEHLKDYGGWPFTPDMAWLNLQMTAFHHYKTQMQQKGFVASRQPGWSDRVRQFLAPTLQAQDGCDGLHWLDGSVLRFCCDVHDLCYEKVGCNAKSWWQFWTNWTCEYCNGWVVVCFLSGGIDWSDRGMVK